MFLEIAGMLIGIAGTICSAKKKQTIWLTGFVILTIVSFLLILASIILLYAID